MKKGPTRNSWLHLIVFPFLKKGSFQFFEKNFLKFLLKMLTFHLLRRPLNLLWRLLPQFEENQIYSRSVVGDFDGNGYDDLLCQNSRTGVIEIMYSNQNAFEKRLWLNDTEFCIDKDSELLVGDFDGNKKADLLCHNKKTGMNSYAYSTADGNFYSKLNPLVLHIFLYFH